MAGRRKYWRHASRLAWEETVQTLHLNSLVGFMGWLIGSLAALIGLFFWGSADASRDELLTRIFLTFATVSFIPFVFAWKLVGLPPKMHRELRDWTKELEEAIIDSQNADAAVYGLSERYNKGLRLLDGREIDLDAWETEFDSYVKQHFEAGFFLQLCGESPPDRNYTTVQYGADGPVTRIQLPSPTKRERLEEKLHKIAGQMPYAATYYRGRTINSLAFKFGSIRLFGLPEHRSPSSTATETPQ